MAPSYSVEQYLTRSYRRPEHKIEGGIIKPGEQREAPPAAVVGQGKREITVPSLNEM